MATANDQALDPATLRLLAAELDEIADAAARACACAAHQWSAARASMQAADYRTRALKVEASAREGTPLARALAEVDAWWTDYDAARKTRPLIVSPSGLIKMIEYLVTAHRATQPVKIDRGNT